MYKLRAYTEKQPFSRSIALYFYTKNDDGTMSVISDIVMTTLEGAAATPPALSIEYETAQELMDNLWQCGLRPSEGTGSAGALKATENHLADMREFARRLLDMVNGKDK